MDNNFEQKNIDNNEIINKIYTQNPQEMMVKKVSSIILIIAVLLGIVFGVNYFFNKKPLVVEDNSKLTAEQMLRALEALPPSDSENEFSKDQMIDSLKKVPDGNTENKITREQMLKALQNN